MVIGVFGESCVGKSTFAQLLREGLGAEVFTGKDYLRLAKSEGVALTLFRNKLNDSLAGDHIVYVISEREHLKLLPNGAMRVLMTADLDRILERFSVRMHGNLPLPVKQMLERKHGCFDTEVHEYHIHNNEDLEGICARIMEALR